MGARNSSHQENAARKHVAMEGNKDQSGGDVHVAVEVTGSAYGSHSSPLPVYLKFEDVKYKILLKPKHKISWRFVKPAIVVPTEKEILHGVSGSVAPGEVLAIMGPSGCGKTTLLNVFGGRVSQANVTGSVTYNELPYNKSLRRRIGFVAQDDVLYPHLTVTETLMYAALLRLPNSFTKQQKIQRVEEISIQLGLERCRDTIIGGRFLRGISGGERKRVCIGHEILIDPSLLLLDEPTSGLDSTIALKVIQLIQSIAQGGRTVVTSIHQPSTRLFYMFSKVILLSKGQTIYYGKAAEAMDYFFSIGLSPAMAMNPAPDFLLDVANGNLDAISIPPALDISKATKTIKNEIAEGHLARKEFLQYLVAKFNLGTVMQENNKQLESVFFKEELKEAILEKQEWSTSWWQQFYVLLIRGLAERRHEDLGSHRMFQVTAMSIIVGLLWWQSNTQTENRLADQVGLLFFISMFWTFVPMFMAMHTFPLERAMLAKERASNMYRLSAYFLSRTLGDVPMDMLLIFTFITIVYFTTHLRMAPQAFILTLLTVILQTMATQGLGLFLGATMMDVRKGTTLATVLMHTFMLTGGYYIQHIPVSIKWLKYLSFNYQSFKLLVKVQYSANQRYSCSSPEGCSINTSPSIHNVQLGGGGAEAWALLLLFVAYRILGYVALRRMEIGV
ncbi:hypothetical protein O6H91_20G011600 [Diphasiastrum complanatum]|uniref:Uncharacterized protein n=1 Tax=Diphasiastrum complanatum TaxID=34168 RepID=A0ACC2AMZ4_DIPCM|nr:hypothetical protein O6H91_20G011600 [Diphasiastrum complanatum]